VKELGIGPRELAQLHAAEKRRLLEGNRVLATEAQRARQAAVDGDNGRRQAVREANRQQVRENRDALREKWGVG
jgi:aspartate/methionine/tyrosine aminotransferase